MRARYYNPDISRFINQDVLRGTPTASQSLNRYAYCQGNPVNQIDPFGLCPINIKMVMAVIHLSLALLGCIPGYGAAFDIINASLFFAEGDTMSGLLCLASAAVDVGNCLSILGEILDMCRLAKAGAMIRTAGIAYTTGTMAYLTGESMANTITLYIDNDYQITDEVAESAGMTVMSGLGTVMGYRALDGSIRQMQSLEVMGTYCFAAGTLVLTEDGYRNIEDIEPGDKVYSTDEETGESGYKEVLQVFVKETEVVTHVFYEVEQEDGETRTEEIETTLNHLFWCEGEWKAAGTLKAGDLLTLADGSQVEVTEITYEDRHTTVYNMEVADYHTYYVGEDGVWVHNTDGCITSGGGLSKENGTDIRTGAGYDAGDTPVRIEGTWTENDMKQALLGHSPNGLGNPDIHHGGQMPGAAKHEILPGNHRNNSALHPNIYNQGVTPEMRLEDRQLHWWYRAREQGADELLPDWIYD